MKDIISGRRAFLRGSGVALALPYFESLVAKSARAAPIKSPKRLCIIYGANGVPAKYWFPQDSSNFNSPILREMKRHSDSYLITRGLYNRNASESAVNVIGGHGNASAAYLTATRPVQNSSKLGPMVASSFEQWIVQEIMAGQSPTLLPQIQFLGQSASETDNLPSVYSHGLSWSAAKIPVVMEDNPIRVFDRLFRTKPNTEDNRSYTKSILDTVLDYGHTLRSKLGQGDQLKLDEYLTNIRSIEKRLKPAKFPAIKCIEPVRPQIDKVVDFAEYQKRLGLMFELVKVAFQCDLTRVAVIMMTSEQSDLVYPDIASDGHHTLTHTKGSEELVMEICRWRTAQVASFIDSLKNNAEGESNLLYNSLVTYGCGMLDPDQHSSQNLPLLLAGNAGGLIPPEKTGKPMNLPENTPLSNVWLGIMKIMMNNPPTRWGSYWDNKMESNTSESDSTGAIDFT